MTRVSILLILLSACPTRVEGPERHPVEQPPPGDEVVADDVPDWIDRIDDHDAWLQLAYRPAYQTAARTEVVKLLIDMEDDWKTYFVQSERWELHYAFARRFIEFPRSHVEEWRDHQAFNIEQYRRPTRRFFLASLVRYLDGGVWALELVPGDNIDAERLRRGFEHIRDQVYFGSQLRFRALSPLQQRHAETIGDAMPTVDLAALMARVRYQPLVTGVAYGYLRIVRGELDVSTLRPNDIVVAEHVPSELPPVSALVTSGLQAPLAHVAILSRNRGTPDMALRDAVDLPEVQALEGQLVRLAVGPQEYVLERATLAEAEPRWEASRPSRPFVPVRDLDANALVDVCTLSLSDIATAGAKASQLGEVCRLQIRNPGGFVVPFHHYAAHLRRHGIQGDIEGLLVDAGFRSDSGLRARKLAELRQKIEAGAANRALVRDIRRRVAGPQRWIFRSSTNAEDLPGFNGAGLYSSVVVGPNPTEAQVADALREVWASVWLQRGYEERDWFRIDQAQVAMAILIQPFVDDVVGNGVAITRNPFDQARPAVFVNVQTREGSVTGAGDDELPEQVLIYTWSEDLEFETISRSTRAQGEILTETDLRALGELLQKIHTQLEPRYADSNAVDVEFLLTRGERRIVVVQARPINVEYAPGTEYREY